MTRYATFIRSINLRRITSPSIALEVIASGVFRSLNDVAPYDGGMNFFGVLGKTPNTQPKKGARMHCKWYGPVSIPLPYGSHDYHAPNVLFDFNGSGQHYQDNDPRYFLPYGSTIQL